LTSIGGSLIIGDWWQGGNSALTSLTGLENLTAIGGSLEISRNDALSSLTGLGNIDAGSIENLKIRSNDFLSACEVQSVCDYLANPGGTIEIHDNAFGCNSQIEVEEACDGVSVEKLSLVNKFLISPNPIEITTQIAYPLNFRKVLAANYHT